MACTAARKTCPRSPCPTAPAGPASAAVERHRSIRAKAHPGSRRAGGRSGDVDDAADFIVYKAKRAGVPLVYVDPAYTSQTCAECGHVDKRNRVNPMPRS
ncbi:zinc ribbon domain-containing protein [Streptomyces sp. NBC_00120]|uniref:zinc ribbon domain-containing protein n=1 Tax=Streptomyces sp. NBC_00120 TaxID=2975660 RepID=UPI00225A76AF|nr:zinc ribbon domain-containing protein [Streptomyces sp. NBC_00120]MCX5319907.1 transposase [Streptomyces sp. NBC_00120]